MSWKIIIDFTSQERIKTKITYFATQHIASGMEVMSNTIKERKVLDD